MAKQNGQLFDNPKEKKEKPKSKDPNIVIIESFTTEETYYEVNIKEETCSCPAFSHHPNKRCKHLKKVLEGKTPAKKKNMWTKNGYNIYDVTSALIKCVRRGYEERALFWAFEMQETNDWYLWRRLLALSAEDIGLGNPMAVVVVTSCHDAYYKVQDKGTGQLFLTEAVLYMCRSPKNRLIDYACMTMNEKRKRGKKIPIPDWAYDNHTLKGKNMGRGLDYFLTESSKEYPVEEVPSIIKVNSKEEKEITKKLEVSSKEDLKIYKELAEKTQTTNY